MKKLMIAAAVACVAVFAEAANVNWGSGMLYEAKDKTGGWSTTFLGTGAKMTATMNVYMIDATDWTADGVASMTQKQLFDYVSSKSADYTGNNISGDNKLNTIGVGTDALSKNTAYYSIVTATYTDTKFDNTEMYMAAAAEFTTSDGGQASIMNVLGGTPAAGGPRDWQAAAVPEPTSGLLLLLGVAGLALRRRRA